MTVLETPGRIGKLKLKNRIVMAPLGTNYGTTDGLSTERDKLYYAERAKGGVALIMTEAMVISENARQHNNSLLVTHDRFIPGVASVVRAIKDGGALAVGQISHRGGLLRRSVLNMEPVGPSPWTNPNTGDPVRALTIPEILQIQRDYVTAACRMLRAGYDGVELHAANGYLFHQFFSPRINKRTDQYGGSIENRMRFLMETVGRIKDALPDYPLFVRFSATEYIEGGYTEEEAVYLAQTLEKNGVDALDLSGGTNESHELSRFCIQPPSFPRGCLEPYAQPIKKAVSIPVIVAGRIIEPCDAEKIITAGSADFISLGRALVADPYWCLKAFRKIKTPIRRCISCNVCFERLTRERDMSCVQNPMVGTEFESLKYAEPQVFKDLDRRRSPKRKKILVLGAGVSGIEAARILAANGHHVEVWEKADAVGGQMPLAVAAPDKGEVSGVWSYRWEQIVSLDVPVKTRVKVTKEDVKRFAPDRVIVATGARPKKLSLDVPSSVRVVQAWDVLRAPRQVPVGSRVTIIGGGMVGIETADLLACRGCRITVIERLPVVAKEMAQNNRTDVLLRLKARGVVLLVEAEIQRIDEKQIYVNVRGQPHSVEAGSCLITAVGPEPNRDVVPVLEQANVPYVLVGDCNQPGDFLTGIREAWMVALSIEYDSEALPAKNKRSRLDQVSAITQEVGAR